MRRWRHPSKDPDDYVRPAPRRWRSRRTDRAVGVLLIASALVLNLIGEGPAVGLIVLGTLFIVFTFV